MDRSSSIQPVSKVNPLNIPEIRIRISLYLDIQDCLSCILVCKDWHPDFIYPIWYSVDFESQPRFKDLSAAKIKQHGHHLRRVDELTSKSELDLLVMAGCPGLSHFMAELGETRDLAPRCFHFLQGHMATLVELDLCGDDVDLADLVRTPDSRLPISIFELKESNLLLGGNRAMTGIPLQRLFLQKFWMPRDQFSDLLQACPNLHYIWMHSIILHEYGRPLNKPLFQHQKLRELGTGARFTLRPDLYNSDAHSLFHHFPNLELWRVTSADGSISHNKDLAQEIKRQCPKLVKVAFYDCEPNHIASILATVFPKVTSCTLSLDALTLSVLSTILLHRRSLLHVTFTDGFDPDYERDESDLDASSCLVGIERAIQLLPQTCPNLLHFSVPGFEMGIDHMLEAPWMCTGLKELRIWIKGLTTLKAIEETLDMWVEARLSQMEQKGSADYVSRELPNGVLGLDMDDTPSIPSDSTSEGNEEMDIRTIQEKVVRHLLQHDDLRVLSLGSREVIL